MGEESTGKIMQIPFVDLKSEYASIQSEIDIAIKSVIAETAFIGGSFVRDFEGEFADLCGAKHCVGVGNGTDAIFLALRALGVGENPRDEVITVANSFIASSEAITQAGARVVFVDCDPTSYNIKLEQIEAATGPNTRAIIPVHLYGQPAEIKQICEFAQKRDIYVIEDAAQSHAAEFEGRTIGTFGNAACFSFYPGKNLGAYGDAGAVVTNDTALATRIRMLANHGRMTKYDHECEGYNSRLDGLQAAILKAKLRHLDDWIDRRRRAAAIYDERLTGTSVITPKVRDGLKHVYHLYVVRVPNRDKVRSRLTEKGVATGIHYPTALPNLSAYSYLGHSPDDFPVATQFSGEILSLPLFPQITEAQISFVCDALLSTLN